MIFHGGYGQENIIKMRIVAKIRKKGKFGILGYYILQNIFIYNLIYKVL